MYIGVDLGTTHSVISTIAEDGTIKLVKTKDGRDTVPSFIWVSDENIGKLKYAVGQKAYDRMKTDPEHVLFSYKTLIDQNIVLKEINGIKFTPITCSTLNLKYIVDVVKSQYSGEIEGAVITVPAYFDESQKAATKGAALRAGLKDVYLIPEPTAAALAYGRIKAKESNILVFDLGGGTFDISILRVEPDKDGDPVVNVLGLSGDNHLGGYDVDRAIAMHIISELGLKIKPSDTDMVDKLVAHAETLKIEVSNNIIKGKPNKDSTINITLQSGKKKIDVNYTLTEEVFREIATPIIDRAISKVIPALTKVGAGIDTLDELVLVGGSTRIPIVRERLTEISDGKFTREYFDSYKVDPDLAVGMGAGEYMKNIVEKKNKNTSVVAKPIGIELNDGTMGVILQSNRMLPAKARRSFTNLEGNETELLIEIYEGFAKTAVNNTKLGTLVVPVKPQPKNTHAVEVSLKMNQDGTLEVESRVNMVKKGIIIERDFNIEDNVLEQMESDIKNSSPDGKSKSNKKTKGKKSTKSKEGESEEENQGDTESTLEF